MCTGKHVAAVENKSNSLAINIHVDEHSYCNVTISKNKKRSILHSLFLFHPCEQDLRKAIDVIHLESMELKKRTLLDLPRYVRRDGRLPLLLRRLREEGRQTFLLTNSDWWYTQQIMRYLLTDQYDETGM